MGRSMPGPWFPDAWSEPHHFALIPLCPNRRVKVLSTKEEGPKKVLNALWLLHLASFAQVWELPRAKALVKSLQSRPQALWQAPQALCFPVSALLSSALCVWQYIEPATSGLAPNFCNQIRVLPLRWISQDMSRFSRDGVSLAVGCANGDCLPRAQGSFEVTVSRLRAGPAAVSARPQLLEPWFAKEWIQGMDNFQKVLPWLDKSGVLRDSSHRQLPLQVRQMDGLVLSTLRQEAAS